MRQEVHQSPCSPLHELVHIFSVTPQDMETITPTSSPPNRRLKCKTTIHSSVEESVAHASSSSKVTIYSDGSGLGGYVGTATTSYKARSEPKILKYHLGPLDAHTTFEAEAVGLLLALHLLSLERGACSATIMLDNQALIQTLEHRKPKPAQHIMEELTCQISSAYRQVRHLDFELNIMWVKGHANIEGNELVDGAAKLAVGGESSAASLLPPMLMSSLPVSIMARKQAFTASLHKQ